MLPPAQNLYLNILLLRFIHEGQELIHNDFANNQLQVNLDLS